MNGLIILFTIYAVVCKNQHIGLIGGWSWSLTLAPLMFMILLKALDSLLKDIQAKEKADMIK